MAESQSQEVPPSQRKYYQCEYCKVLFDSKTKLAEHRNKIHKVGESVQKRNFWMEETTADLVKLNGKRQSLKESTNCNYCKQPISSPYDRCLISEQKKDTFTEHFACQKCVLKLI